MSYTWSGNEYVKDLEKQLAQNLEKAAIHLVNEIKKELNRSQPYKIYKGKAGRWYKGLQPSRPGESPKKVRGDLQRSITYEMGSDKKSAKVGTNLDYGAALELGTWCLKPRPYLRSTLIKEEGKINEIMGE